MFLSKTIQNQNEFLKYFPTILKWHLRATLSITQNLKLVQYIQKAKDFKKEIGAPY